MLFVVDPDQSRHCVRREYFSEPEPDAEPAKEIRYRIFFRGDEVT
jgi:hypothetical protein